jgi:hypothetical protein
MFERQKLGVFSIFQRNPPQSWIPCESSTLT